VCKQHMYLVKEIYLTLQGEGAQAGRVAVFCRFCGCNLWSGREEDRDLAECMFCDTDFLGTNGPNGGRYSSPEDLSQKIVEIWSAGPQKEEPGQDSNIARLVVFTGGEPLLQLDGPLASSLKSLGFDVAVETNGTRHLVTGIDWVTVSPKTKLDSILVRSGQELKLVYPQKHIQPKEFEELDFGIFYLSPLWSSNQNVFRHNKEMAIEYCLKNPKWRLTMQYHKIWGLS